MSASSTPLPGKEFVRTVADRRATGRALRKEVPRSSHAEWSPVADRPDPISLLEEQNVSRQAQLVPIRYGRMAASPFGFLRGSGYGPGPRRDSSYKSGSPGLRRCSSQ